MYLINYTYEGYFYGTIKVLKWFVPELDTKFKMDQYEGDFHGTIKVLKWFVPELHTMFKMDQCSNF